MSVLDAPATQTRWARMLASYRRALPTAARHPATWLFVAICLLCAACLAVVGDTGLLPLALGSAVGTSLFILLTIPLTAPITAAPWPTPTPTKARRRLWTQVGALAVFALLISHWTVSGHDLLPHEFQSIPLWTPFLEWTYNAVQSLLGSRLPARFPLNNVAPVIMLLLPGAALLLLGARPGELGFARGYRSLRVAAVWSLAPLAIIAINLALGAMSPAFLLWRTLQTTFNSGPFEEFFFRGALFTRLARLLGDGWGIVLSGIAFGLLHVATETASDTHGNLLAGTAAAILLQGVGGVGFAIVVRRTRNLLASSLIHVISNVAFG
jgi:membrane protease YdiL (CAAX protease family)